MSDIIALLENETFNPVNASFLRSALTAMQSEITKCNTDLSVIQTNSDQFFLTTNAVFILMMQAGFGFFEAGCVGKKNVVNMLFKNVMDAFFGGLSYWMIGYAVAFGEPCNSFIGMNHFFGLNLESRAYSTWFFHYSFCVTAATIVSGSVAERCDFKGYVVYSAIITGLTYPTITHWAWHSGESCKGFLVQLGYQDFAGSGVVHMTGGLCALIGCIVLGPRLGRFPRYEGDPAVVPLLGHNLPFAVLGAFLLFVGFFAFNGGSQASISSNLDGEQTGRAMMNTVLAGSPAAVVGMILGRFATKERKFNLTMTLATGLAGMVAICAGCNAVDPWAAIVIGTIGAVVTFFVSKLMVTLQLDDPADAVAVHLGSGTWGVLSTPLFDRDHGVLFYWNKEAWLGFAYNAAGACSIIVWCVATVLPVFIVLKKIGWLRVSMEMELGGLDVPKHGQGGYPDESYKGMSEEEVLNLYRGVGKEEGDFDLRHRVRAIEEAEYERPKGVWASFAAGTATVFPNMPNPRARSSTETGNAVMNSEGI